MSRQTSDQNKGQAHQGKEAGIYTEWLMSELGAGVQMMKHTEKLLSGTRNWQNVQI